MGTHFTHAMVLHAKINGVPFMTISKRLMIICKAPVIVKHMILGFDVYKQDDIQFTKAL
jgi:hypothetical protein